VKESRTIVDLADRYIARLEAAKKDLTINGRTDEAVAAKKEIERVRQSKPVTAARFAIADRDACSQPLVTGQTAPKPMDTGMTACPQCNGAGRMLSACSRCGGTGRCASCGGSGQRQSGLSGTGGTVGCVSCRSSGHCRFCEGAGSEKGGPCPRCGGTGKVAAASSVPESVKAPTVAPAVAATVTTETPSAVKTHDPEDVARQLREYTERLTTLNDKYKTCKPVEAKFGDVSRNPDQYYGKLLQSEVYLVDARPRQIRVAASLNDAKLGGQTLIPASTAVGDKASSLMWAIKRSDAVVVVYGVVSRENFTVFEVHQP